MSGVLFAAAVGCVGLASLAAGLLVVRRLREAGTHQELLAQRGIYWKLYQLQYKDQEIRGDGRPSAAALPEPESQSVE